jgi:hypothetical protein
MVFVAAIGISFEASPKSVSRLEIGNRQSPIGNRQRNFAPGAKNCLYRPYPNGTFSVIEG